MLLSKLLWEHVQTFCEKNSLSKTLEKTTNTCSTIVLTNPTLVLQLLVDEMELRIETNIAFNDNEKKQDRRLLVNSNERIRWLRHKALRAWRRTTRNKALVEMIQVYLATIQNVLDKDPCDEL